MPTTASRKVSSRPPHRFGLTDGQPVPPTPCSSRHDDRQRGQPRDRASARQRDVGRTAPRPTNADPDQRGVGQQRDRRTSPSGDETASSAASSSWPAVSQMASVRGVPPAGRRREAGEDRQQRQAEPDPPRLLGRVLADQEQPEVARDYAPARVGQRPLDADEQAPTTSDAERRRDQRVAPGVNRLRRSQPSGPDASPRGGGSAVGGHRPQRSCDLDAPVVEVHDQRRDQADGEVDAHHQHDHRTGWPVWLAIVRLTSNRSG